MDRSFKPAEIGLQRDDLCCEQRLSYSAVQGTWRVLQNSLSSELVTNDRPLPAAMLEIVSCIDAESARTGNAKSRSTDRLQTVAHGSPNGIRIRVFTVRG